MKFFKRQARVDIELGPKLFKSIVRVLEDPSGLTDHEQVAYAGRHVSQNLEIVGESNYQEEIKLFKKGWSYGFLVPEQDNPHDSNAVALYLIDEKYNIHKVGVLSRPMAEKSSKAIRNLLVSKSQVVPVLAKVEGGTKDKPNLGVFASAKTEAVRFL